MAEVVRVNDFPTGTVTFLFTDIEGSTRLWETRQPAMQQALARHDAIVRGAIESNYGYLVKNTGDGAHAAFALAQDALAAAIAAQRALAGHDWGEVGIKSRMALHSGAAEQRDRDYFGPALNRAARLMAAGHGGQILMSLATMELVRDHLPADTTLRDLGERRLKDLIRPERVFQVVAPDLPNDFPALATLDARPNNLPAQTTPLIGREQEIRAVKEKLSEAKVRLLTLTGVGGAGKTRLALQVAAEMVDDFEHGVFFIELATLVDPAFVLPRIAHSLGVTEAGSRLLKEVLADYLRSKQMLLVLDNFEQVIDSASAITDLLAAAPRLKVLITSRELLQLAGEYVYQVPALAVPDSKRMPTLAGLSQYEAVALFIDRALMANPGFRVTNENAPAVAEICIQLDGLPLAIELAAARVRVLPPLQMLAGLSDRLRFLKGGARDRPARQQTLRGAIDWSYDLLSPGEQALFCRLAVFVGGWTFVAAEHVCSSRGLDEASVLDLLTSLADKSLVLAEERSGATRYRMLETVREYARGRLREMDEETHWQDRHLAYFVAWAEEAAATNDGAEQRPLLEQLEAEHDNVRSALAWSAEPGGDGASGLRLTHVFDWLWKVRGHFQEGRGWLSKLLAATPGGPPAARASAFRDAGHMALLLGEHASARTLLEEALALSRELGDQRGIAATLSRLGEVARRQGDYVTARAQLDAGLAIQRELGDQPSTYFALAGLGHLAADQGDYAAARTLLEESLAVCREMGAQKGIAMRLHDLGCVATEQGDYTAARALFDECLPIFRELGDRTGIAATLEGMGIGALERGDNGVAAALLKEGLAIFRELSYRDGIANSLDRLAEVAMAVSEPGSAARMWGAAERLREELGGHIPPSARVRYDRRVAAARAAMGDDAAFHRAWQEGRMMTLEQAVEYAMAERDV